MADLVFGRPPYTGGPAHLVFGATVTPPEILPSHVVGTVSLGSVVVSGAVVVSAPPAPVAVVGAVSFGGISVTGSALYLNRNPRRASGSTVAAHQAAIPSAAVLHTPWGLSEHTAAQRSPAWQPANPEARTALPGWESAKRRAGNTAAAWQPAAPIGSSAASAHQQAFAVADQVRAMWQAAEARAQQARMDYQRAIAVLDQVTGRWQPAQGRHRSTVSRAGKGKAQARHLVAPWQTAQRSPRGQELWPIPGPVVPPGRAPSTHLVFSCPPRVGGAVHLVFGHVCAYKPALVSVPVRRVYVTINSIDLRRVAGDVSLPADAFNLALDADSWTFSWSASLHKSAEPLVSLFDELEARINGVPYRLAVGKVARDRRFPQTRLKVSGRGLAQVLADPQAPVVSYDNTTQRTAQQLMADVLTVNGVSMGWDIDWGLTDWLVPANAWAFQGTAMQALADIAGAAGGYVQPHPTSRILRVLPRYPAAPWTWGGVTPDLELPAAVCEVESFERVERPGYNRVYVGGASQGVFGPVTRTGTAGDVLAPQVTHSLITDAAAHRQRGLAELADSGSQVHLSLTLPVLPETGLILPGTMARYTADQTRMGIVRSTSLTWSSPVMRQTIGLECHEPA